MFDLLSDIFETIRLRGTLYFRTDYSPPWAITVPAYAQAARFHFVIQGRCHVSRFSQSRIGVSLHIVPTVLQTVRI
jgi:AraC family transcriptional regulator, activator of mtrCDE